MDRPNDQKIGYVVLINQDAPMAIAADPRIHITAGKVEMGIIRRWRRNCEIVTVALIRAYEPMLLVRVHERYIKIL